MRLTTLFLIILSTPAYAGETVATWYGQEHAGKRTASGERFNPDGLTAAHRSLPFGTCLRVSNPKTGRSVSIRVNDRGPFTKGVSLDLSHGAAGLLACVQRRV
jgi:rare lipoprotein A